nr:DNA modification methylase (COG0863) [uncultured Mediterranean phage uvMED]
MIDIRVGDCRNVLKELPNNYFHTCVTSPPYWGLRDYGNDGQLGLEKTPKEFVDNLVKVFGEVKRVLRDDGTIWLNLGDSYSSGGRTSTTNQTVRGDKDYGVTRPAVCKDIKPKDLVGIPWRVAFALQEDGWYLRQDIIWHKPNPMPESVTDRCTKAHEYIFLLSKQPKYYFDNESIKDKSLTQNIQSNNQKLSKYKNFEEEKKYRQGIHHKRGENIVVSRPKLPSKKQFLDFIKSKTNLNFLIKNTNIKKTTIEHWFRNDNGFSFPKKDDWLKINDLVNDWSEEYNFINYGLTYEETHFDTVVTNESKNKRSVWTVTTKPYKEAHFATYPPDLIEPCILAGCPENGNILDPFGGAGTTALVADRLNRNATIIELNKDYIDIADKRIVNDSPLFTKVNVL